LVEPHRIKKVIARTSEHQKDQSLSPEPLDERDGSEEKTKNKNLTE
jgi:hypothetical protein